MTPALISNRRGYLWLAVLLASLLGCGAAVPVPDAAKKFMDDTFIFNRQNAAIFQGPFLGRDGLLADTSTLWVERVR